MLVDVAAAAVTLRTVEQRLVDQHRRLTDARAFAGLRRDKQAIFSQETDLKDSPH